MNRTFEFTINITLENNGVRAFERGTKYKSIE